MSSNALKSAQALSIYRSALRVFSLSRKLNLNSTAYFYSQNLPGTEVYYTSEFILNDSLELPLCIAQAETSSNQLKKRDYQNKVIALVTRMKSNCNGLQDSPVSEFVHYKILKQEIATLCKLAKRWMYVSVQYN